MEDEIFISFGDATDTADFLEMLVAHAAAHGIRLEDYIEAFIEHLRISCVQTQ